MIYLVLVLLVVGLALWLWSNCNAALKLQKSVSAARDKLDQRLKARHQSVGNFADSARRMSSRQEELVQKMTDAADKAATATGQPLAERETVEEELGDAVGRLLQSLQNENGMDDSESYIKLRDEVLDSEDSLTLIRQEYNHLAARLNLTRRMFPVNLLVDKLAIKQADEFEIEDTFARYPLRIKATMPTPRRAILAEEGISKEGTENISPTAG